MKYFILLLLLFSITHYTNWRDVEIARWERDLKKQTDSKWDNYKEPTIGEEIYITHQWCAYVFKMAEYFEEG